MDMKINIEGKSICRDCLFSTFTLKNFQPGNRLCLITNRTVKYFSECEIPETRLKKEEKLRMSKLVVQK